MQERIRLSFYVALNSLKIKLLDVQMSLLCRASDVSSRTIELCDITIKLCERSKRVP